MYNNLSDKNVYDKRQQAQLLSPLSIKINRQNFIFHFISLFQMAHEFTAIIKVRVKSRAPLSSLGQVLFQ